MEKGGKTFIASTRRHSSKVEEQLIWLGIVQNIDIVDCYRGIEEKTLLKSSEPHQDRGAEEIQPDSSSLDLESNRLEVIPEVKESPLRFKQKGPD